MNINLRQLRKQKNMSIRQLSKKSGIAQGYLSQLDTGKKTNPSANTICGICRALRCTPNDLISCEEEHNDG